MLKYYLYYALAFKFCALCQLNMSTKSFISTAQNVLLKQHQKECETLYPGDSMCQLRCTMKNARLIDGDGDLRRNSLSLYFPNLTTDQESTICKECYPIKVASCAKAAELKRCLEGSYSKLEQSGQEVNLWPALYEQPIQWKPRKVTSLFKESSVDTMITKTENIRENIVEEGKTMEEDSTEDMATEEEETTDEDTTGEVFPAENDDTTEEIFTEEEDTVEEDETTEENTTEEISTEEYATEEVFTEKEDTDEEEANAEEKTTDEDTIGEVSTDENDDTTEEIFTEEEDTDEKEEITEEDSTEEYTTEEVSTEEFFTEEGDTDEEEDNAEEISTRGKDIDEEENTEENYNVGDSNEEVFTDEESSDEEEKFVEEEKSMEENSTEEVSIEEEDTTEEDTTEEASSDEKEDTTEEVSTEGEEIDEKKETTEEDSSEEDANEEVSNDTTENDTTGEDSAEEISTEEDDTTEEYTSEEEESTNELRNTTESEVATEVTTKKGRMKHSKSYKNQSAESPTKNFTKHFLYEKLGVWKENTDGITRKENFEKENKNASYCLIIASVLKTQFHMLEVRSVNKKIYKKVIDWTLYNLDAAIHNNPNLKVPDFPSDILNNQVLIPSTELSAEATPKEPISIVVTQAEYKGERKNQRSSAVESTTLSLLQHLLIPYN